MDIQNLIAFTAVATLLVISPGPNGFLIAKTVSVSGKRLGFLNILGFVAAFYVHGSLSIFGISLLLVQSAYAFFVFKMLGAAYLIWIGTKALLAAFRFEKSSNEKPNNENSSSEQSARIELAKVHKKGISNIAAFWEGFLTNILNPKTSLFYLAAFPQFLSVDERPISAFVLVTAHSAVNFLWFSFMVLMLAHVATFAKSNRVKRWINSITGAAFIGFGSKLALLKAG